MDIEIDEGTGLPVLPRGYFWRVSRTNIIGHHEVQIRHGWRFLSLVEDYAQIHPAEISPGLIRYWADWLAQRFYAGNYALTYPRTNEFVGNYPPKSL